MDDFYCCIVGSPRSGTTLTGRILDCHSRIGTWFVPYFVWEKRYAERPHDLLGCADVTALAKGEIQDQFRYFHARTGVSVVVDQSPRNSLKMGFVREVFPEVRFIHVLRDGRDAVLSIYREWQKRRATFEAAGGGGLDVRKALRSLREFLDFQPLLKHKFQALAFETGGFSPNTAKHYYRRRWKGVPGWGPRFPGWEKTLEDKGVLGCCAMQWKECVSNVSREIAEVPAARTHTIRYEELLADPGGVAAGMVDFLGEGAEEAMFRRMPVIRSGNSRKWEKGFTPEELELVMELIGPELAEQGYGD